VLTLFYQIYILIFTVATLSCNTTQSDKVVWHNREGKK